MKEWEEKRRQRNREIKREGARGGKKLIIRYGGEECRRRWQKEREGRETWKKNNEKERKGK